MELKGRFDEIPDFKYDHTLQFTDDFGDFYLFNKEEYRKNEEFMVFDIFRVIEK